MDKSRLPLLIFGILAALLAIGLTINNDELPSPLIGKPAPRLGVNGEIAPDHPAAALIADQPWLLNVWASWCSGCRVEHSALTNLIERSGINAIGLNYKDNALQANSWLKQLGNPFNAIVTDAEGNIGIEWGVYGVPETFIVDRDGVVRHKVVGPVTMARVEDELLPLIAKLQDAAND